MNQVHGQSTVTSSHHHAARGLAQSFGLHPSVAALSLCIDQMLFAGETVTLGMLWPISLGVSAALGAIAYKAQCHWFHDDVESAKLKAGILALLCAIPTGLPSMLFVPAGIVGLFRRS